MGKVFKKIEEKFKNLFGLVFNNKRRSRLGVRVQEFERARPRNYRTCPSAPLFLELPDQLLGAEVLRRDQSFELLRRAKFFLSLRSVEDFESLLGLDWRRVWNKENPNRPVLTLLDLFTSVKYAHECILPLTARLRRHGIDPSSVNWNGSPWGRRALLQVSQEKNSLFFDAAKVISRPDVPTSGDLFSEEFVDVVAAEKDGNTTVRIDDICRSHSIWLDPVDAPKELYKWRLRVQKAICWAYANDCVPVMMTLTIFHRWHYLADLLRVLQKSWDKFIISGRPAARRKEAMGLEGYVRRLEITINDGLENSLDVGEPATNSGWHPHFHVILFVPKDKFETLSDIESQLKDDWVDIVSEQFRLEFGEEIDKSYLPAFRQHGLHLSRYNKGERRGQLRPVKDSAYLDKIEGYDHQHVYGIDKEVSSDVIKDGKIPFDLLREITAANIDLWCEYAIATKGVPAFQFSRPILKKINAYFEAHPDKNPVSADLPSSKVVAHIDAEIYRLFYRNFLIPELRKKAAEGFEALTSWIKDKFVELGISALCDDPTALPRPPNSVDDLLSKKISSV